MREAVAEVVPIRTGAVMRESEESDRGGQQRAKGPSTREVPLGELDKRASKVLAEVMRGEVAVISRYGTPVAMILPLELAVSRLPEELVFSGDLRELAERFEERASRRHRSRLLHGRWYHGHGIHGPYRRQREQRQRQAQRTLLRRKHERERREREREREQES
jgi:prevent-host-death family protein